MKRIGVIIDGKLVYGEEASLGDILGKPIPPEPEHPLRKLRRLVAQASKY